MLRVWGARVAADVAHAAGGDVGGGAATCAPWWRSPKLTSQQLAAVEGVLAALELDFDFYALPLDELALGLQERVPLAVLGQVRQHCPHRLGRRIYVYAGVYLAREAHFGGRRTRASGIHAGRQKCRRKSRR